MMVMGIISYQVFPANMGGQKDIALFYKYLHTKTDLVLVASKENIVEAIPHSNAHNFIYNHNKAWLNIFYINKLVLLIKQYKVDAIIIDHSYFGWIGILLKLFTGKPFIIHSHNIEAIRFKTDGKKWWRLYEYYERWVHAKANHVFYKCDEDANYALQQWKLKNHSFTIVPFGTDLQQTPSIEEKQNAKKFICTKHNIEEDATIFLFNGTLDFTPNVESLQIIVEYIIPYLNKQNFNYKIIICGNRISNELLQQLQSIHNIVYAGFVNDIAVYTKGVDAFINPSATATGIKTKIVEALANNTTVIASQASTRGFNIKALNGKLIAIESNKHKAFSEAMIKTKVSKYVETPASFYTMFYWENIVHQAFLSLQTMLKK